MGSAFDKADKGRKSAKRKQMSSSDSTSSESDNNRAGTSGISRQELDDAEIDKRRRPTSETVTEDVPVAKKKSKKGKKQTPEKAPEA